MKQNNSNNINEGFKLPDNYFNNFKKDLDKKIIEQSSSKNKLIHLHSKQAKYSILIAASLLLLFGLSYSFMPKTLVEHKVTFVNDSVSKTRKNLEFNLKKDTNNNDELMALFIDDENIDEYLDNYLIDGVTSNE